MEEQFCEVESGNKPYAVSRKQRKYVVFNFLLSEQIKTQHRCCIQCNFYIQGIKNTENRFFLTFRLAASSEGKELFSSDEAARRNIRKKTIFSDKKLNSIE